MLVGTLPFHAGTEFDIYKVIRTQDWDVPAQMGLDLFPTGGGHRKRPAAAKRRECHGPVAVGRCVIIRRVLHAT